MRAGLCDRQHASIGPSMSRHSGSVPVDSGSGFVAITNPVLHSMTGPGMVPMVPLSVGSCSLRSHGLILRSSGWAQLDSPAIPVKRLPQQSISDRDAAGSSRAYEAPSEEPRGGPSVALAL